MKLQANILLRVLTPFILLAGSILLFHACQDRKTPRQNPLRLQRPSVTTN